MALPTFTIDTNKNNIYMYLENINGPADVKLLSVPQLDTLAEEIRSALLYKISEYGGHFGPNFGMVEATIALHYIFNSPTDKFVFDVSHQSYPHKILTGRKDAFLNPEKFSEVTGYTEPNESEHDMFTIGHTSTSISMACGLAKARDLMGKHENIIAIIGDGSLTGGEAFEGLNYAKQLHSNLIIVVNDNDQSISDTNGGLKYHLQELRESKGMSSNNMFKALGFDYVYVDEGNSIPPLLEAFSKVKDADHPVVVHIKTLKGKGYAIAEANKEDWHWFPPFYAETGEKRRKMTGENYDDMVGDYLLKKMKNDPSVCAILAAVPATLGFNKERRDMAGKQFIDVDICEQHALSLAAGIAKNGGKPVVGTFSTFYQRAYDQIAQDICINKMPVTILIRNGSIWAGNDVTHTGWLDMAAFANIPNMVYLCPTNSEEYFAMLDWSIEQNEHPVCIRIPRNGVHHVTTPVEKDYSNLNKNLVTIKGEKVAIFAVGDFFQIGEELATAIKEQLGFQPTLINPRYVAGLDEDLLNKLTPDHSTVITLEDSILDGGYGQKIASFYGSSDMKVLNYGLKKEYLDGYKASEVIREYGITTEEIIRKLDSYKLK